MKRIHTGVLDYVPECKELADRLYLLYVASEGSKTELLEVLARVERALL